MEWESLRKEVEFLKGCQLQYFLLSVTSVVAFIGLLRLGPSDFATLENTYPWIFLVPLMIVVPCWLIYFDKAKSIGRIVGYIMILEEFMLADDNETRSKFVGWERSLAKFRKAFVANTLRRKDNLYPLTRIEQFWRVLTLRSTNKYWTYHFYAFGSASAICVLLSSYLRINTPIVFWLVVAAYLFLLGYTLEQLRRLVFGRNSYVAHEDAWRRMLFENTGE